MINFDAVVYSECRYEKSDKFLLTLIIRYMFLTTFPFDNTC